MEKKFKNIIFVSLLAATSLCACSLFGNNSLELSDHQLVLEPGQSHQLEIKKNNDNDIFYEITNSEVISIDKDTQSITAKKEGRSTLKIYQDSKTTDTCEVVVRFGHIPPTDPLNVATIAHKGYHVDVIENTYLAFSEAGRRNFYGIETDIHRTLDNKWVCNHDSKVKGMSKNISECTLEEILAINLSDDPNITANVCTFEDYITICNAYNKHPVIEFKESTPKQYLEDVIRILKSNAVLDEVIFISKLGDVLGSLVNIKNENGYKYDLQMLTEGNGWRNVSEVLNLSSQYEAITSEVVNDCQLNGQYVAAWTVNDRETAYSLMDLGVKYITTDFFECADQLLDNTLFGI